MVIITFLNLQVIKAAILLLPGFYVVIVCNYYLLTPGSHSLKLSPARFVNFLAWFKRFAVAHLLPTQPGHPSAGRQNEYWR